MAREHLTPDERAEYDALMYEAGYDEAGKPRPSYEIGPRVAQALGKSADQAHRGWALHVRDEITVSGSLARWRKWNKARALIEVAGVTYVTTKAATVGVRRADAKTGATYYQAAFWEDLTRAELAQVIERAAKQTDAETKTIALARRLLALLDRVPEAVTVSDAARELGLTTASYLAAIDDIDEAA